MIRPLFLLLLFFVTVTVNAALTHTARWKLDVIEHTFAGTCFRPGLSSVARVCTNGTLKALLDVHIQNDHGAGLSIAYYDLKDGSVLGSASWAKWDVVTLPAGICLSGRVDALSDAYITTCRFAIADDDHDSPYAHEEECFDSRAQERVIDGCYLPPARRGPGFQLDDSTSGILTIIGLLIVLPGMMVGAYRWYSSRQVHASDVQEVLVPLGRCCTHGEARPEAARVMS